jgi:hypothetical protein
LVLLLTRRGKIEESQTRSGSTTAVASGPILRVPTGEPPM